MCSIWLMNLDDIDRKILDILSKDSRSAFIDIAKKLTLSEGTIRRRVQNLIESGIIKRFTIETWEERPKAVVLITVSPAIPTSQIAERILRLDGVESAFEVAGQDDILIIISAEDISTINQCIDGIRDIEGVENTNTLFVLRKWR